MEVADVWIQDHCLPFSHCLVKYRSQCHFRHQVPQYLKISNLRESIRADFYGLCLIHSIHHRIRILQDCPHFWYEGCSHRIHTQRLVNSHSPAWHRKSQESIRNRWHYYRMSLFPLLHVVSLVYLSTGWLGYHLNSVGIPHIGKGNTSEGRRSSLMWSLRNRSLSFLGQAKDRYLRWSSKSLVYFCFM